MHGALGQVTGLHLGMLEDRSQLRWPTPQPCPSEPSGDRHRSGSLVGDRRPDTDFVYDRLERHTGPTTPFGRFADPLADTAFWTWLYPDLIVTVRSFSRGQMIEPLQPRWI